MSCKFHKLQEYIIDMTNKIIKKDCESLIIFNEWHHIDLLYAFSNAYKKFYNNPEYTYLFQMAGSMCEEHILICANIYKEYHEFEYKNFNIIISRFIKNQFENFEDKFIFKCYCSGYPEDNTIVCEGAGDCLAECQGCFCLEENCTCGHKNHNKICDVFCPHNCKPVECNNFILCENSISEWENKMNSGICFDCTFKYGKINFINEIDECPICLESKPNVKIFCSHKMCIDCWKKIADETPQDNELETWENSPQCPFCREKVWKI